MNHSISQTATYFFNSLLVRKAVEIAKAGDVSMLKFLLGRILPRERSIKIDLPSTIYERDIPGVAAETH